MIKLNSIKNNPNNPRTIDKDKLEKLKKSIKAFERMLELRPMVVDENNVLLGGNMRKRALKELGYTEIPENWVVKASDLTEEQKNEFIIKDNVGFGAWDWETLANEWDAQQLEDWGLDIPGFDSEEQHLEAEEDDYQQPEQMQVDVVLGDLIEFVCEDGRVHRLLCGDSTDSSLIDKLLDGKKVDLLLTDPPYGIDYGNQLISGSEFEEKTNKHGWRNFGNPQWDKNKPENGVLQYLCEITTNQIIWGGNYFTDDLPPTMGWLIWDKGQRGFSLADGEMAWTSFNNALRIKEYSRALANREHKVHATQKPVEIISWCLKYADRHSKNENNLILDTYLGSGTTLIVSHQLGRICYGCELSEKYCQVIIDRMQALDETITVKINGKEYKKAAGGDDVPF